MVVATLHETFRMQNRTERNFWICYQLFIAISSLIGDTLILLASRNRKSFKLNKFLVTILRNIAVCDITLAVTFVLPITVSLFTDTWIFGDYLCYIKGYFDCYFISVNLFLVCALTTGKLLMLRQPTRAKSLSRNKAKLVCFLIWATFLLYPILMFALGKDDFSFDYRTYSCMYGYNAYTWKKIKPATFIMSGIVPNAVIIITTVPSLKYLVAARNSAKRVKVSVPWQGAFTVVLTATVYCLSTVPTMVYLVGSTFVPEDPIAHDQFNFGLLRYGTFIGMIIITSNFFIYTLTITSFRRYLLSKMGAVSTTFLSLNTSSGTADAGGSTENRRIALI